LAKLRKVVVNFVVFVGLCLSVGTPSW